jgi:predicted RNA-binding Zn-ribbon protein involved in translation (DUF1610 family)
MNDLVVRLHRALFEAMQQRSTPLDQPVTVAEIYQDLIPYRLVRSFGFALNADYEFALLQLLAGEEKLARIEPPEVREELRLELISPNPNVGMFRQYAACDVFVSAPEGVAAVAATPRADEQKRSEGAAERPAVPNDWLLGAKEEGSGDRGGKEREHAPAKTGAAASAAGAPARTMSASAKPAAPQKSAEPPAPTPSQETKTPAAAQAAPPAPANPRAESPARPAQNTPVQNVSESGVQPHETVGCGTCGKSLPPGRNVRFCPQCGAEQKARCPSCGSDVDRSWQFCINCGTRVK